LAGGVVAYRSRTQHVCAQSSTEAELIAANAATKVTKCLRFILHELGYTQTEPTPIYEDNDLAIKIVKHSRPTDCSCHVEIRYFALQHWRLVNDIILMHLPGVVNPADMLTKALGWVLHHRHAPYLMGHHGNPCWQFVLVLLPASVSTKTEHTIFIEFSLTIYIAFISIFLAGPFFPALMHSVISHQRRVSAGQLCDLQMGLMHVSSQTAIYG